MTLPDPEDPSFLNVYYAALSGRQKKTEPETLRAVVSRSLMDVIGAYYASADYRRLQASTKEVYSRLLERIRAAPYAIEPMEKMEQKHVRFIVSTFANSPTTANRILRLLGQLFQFGIQHGWFETDPTVGVKRAHVKTKGHAPWTDSDIDQFEKTYPVGTKQRLALALFLYTGQRKSDVVR